MNATNDNDKRLHALSGDTEAITPGDRMSLQIKKTKSKDAGKPQVCEVTKVDKDLGVCRP